MARLRDIAQICKSKNAGPFMLTIDVLFEDPAVYAAVKATGALIFSLPRGSWCRREIVVSAWPTSSRMRSQCSK